MTNLERDVEEDRLARERLGSDAHPTTRKGRERVSIGITARLPAPQIFQLLRGPQQRRMPRHMMVRRGSNA